MTMESPVRICIGAALVVTILLLCSTSTSGLALPEGSSNTTKLIRTRFTRTNSTFITRPNIPNIALNELHPKDSVSEEHTDKNAKYKDRGRIRYNLKSSTESSFRRVRTSTTSTESTISDETPQVIIVTPTPEVKKPAQIIDGMKTFKKTKMPISSSTTPIPKKSKHEEHHEESEYEYETEEQKESSEKYTSNNNFDKSFFTIPSYNDNFHTDSVGSDNKVKSEYSSSPFTAFSSYFPEVNSYDPENHDEPYKDSFFNFDTELTTPKNDFFDKKYQAISSSIIRNLDNVKSKQYSRPNSTKTYKMDNKGPLSLNSGSPKNKSTIIIKNTKEIRLLDNDEAGTDVKELSDVQGTSIYYELSVLSTETYNLSSSDDDCDNETLPADPTLGTLVDQELASIKATHSTPIASTKSVKDLEPGKTETITTNYLPFLDPDSIDLSTVAPGTFAISTQNSLVASSEKSKRVFSNTVIRNRGYSKRLSGNGALDTNNVTPKVESSTPNHIHRVSTRKFHYTTPKTKPVWMAPRRNVTRTYSRSTVPTTIYSEHFSIKDKFPTTTPHSHQPSGSPLSTVSSEIDPVLQTDVSGVKKIVHSQTLSENSIPTLWKRGSTKYSTSTATSAEVDSESGVSDLEIPPTLTAWALASLRSTPAQASSTTNSSASREKSVDENELGDVTDKKETSTTSTTTTTVPINNDIISERYPDGDQNRVFWHEVSPIVPPSSTSLETQNDELVTETKTERLPAESNVSFQNSAKPTLTTEKSKDWVSVTSNVEIETTTDQTKETIPPVDASKSTGFESINKLPSSVTTPLDESPNIADENFSAKETPTTTDYEITTIRFSYRPTETSEPLDRGTTPNWHSVFPTRTKSTTIKDEPVTTYRPRYVTTTEAEETSTVLYETTPALEVSSQVVDNTAKKELSTQPANTAENTETKQDTTTEKLTVKPVMTPTTQINVIQTTTEAPEETTTIIVEVSTEINTERERPQSTSPEVTQSTEASSELTETPPNEIRESSSEENSGSNEVITQDTSKMVPSVSTTFVPTETTTEAGVTEETATESEVTTLSEEIQTTQSPEISDTTPVKMIEQTTEFTTEATTRAVNDLEDLTTFNGEVTTEASSRVLSDEAGTGAAVAIAVSTIGVIALILLVGLLLVVRRRGRRGVYAQRCTPVSLDAYSLDSVSVGHRKGNHRLRASKRSYGNPAYDDEVTSHPMQYAALANFALDVESMSTEFAEIPSVTVRPDEVPPGCEDKNRYSNVLPLPETRVPLKRIGSDPTTEYINANFITGPGNIRNYYIACQAPLPNTVVDFWRMIWEQNSRVIVMLTEYMENGVEKCYEYLPPSEVSDNKRTFGEYQIILMKREQRDKYAISSVQVINLTTRTWREVTHLWYFWPAKGVPDDFESVLDFLSEMRSYMKLAQTAKEFDEEGVEVIYGDQSRSSFHNLSKLRSDENGSGNGVNVYSPSRAEEQLRRSTATNGTLGRMKAASEVEGVRPCTVVCASGAGRSAALIAVDICARALAAGAADVPRVVRELRAQRPHSLSNRHHYIFLYKVLSEYGNKLMGGGVDTI